MAVGRVSFGYLAKLRLLSLIVISFPHSVCACERANNDPVGSAEPITGAWPGDRCKLIEKVTKTAVFGLDKIQERLGTNNQF